MVTIDVVRTVECNLSVKLEFELVLITKLLHVFNELLKRESFYCKQGLYIFQDGFTALNRIYGIWCNTVTRHPASFVPKKCEI